MLLHSYDTALIIITIMMKLEDNQKYFKFHPKNAHNNDNNVPECLVQ
jgi:hypothetical protein